MKRCLQKICGLIDSYEETRKKQRLKDNLLFVVFQNDGVYLSNVKVIDQKSKLQIAVFKALLRQHIIGHIDSVSVGINIVQMASMLRKKGFSSLELEKQVRQAVYLIKKSVSEKYGREIGDNFIVSSKISGQYKLGKKVTLICT